MPKKLVAVAVRQPVLQDYEEEPIPEGHVRVKSDFGSPKRGTELHLYHDENRRFPLALGNMCVGKVIEVGAGRRQSIHGRPGSKPRALAGNTCMASIRITRSSMARQGLADAR